MARKIFRRDTYRSYINMKVAQYYFLRETLGNLGAQGHDILRSALNFHGILEVPHPISSSVR